MSLRSWFRRAKPPDPTPERAPGDLTEAERATIDAVVSIFETSRQPSVESYSTATVLDDGAGITYGLHQTTARSRLPAVLEAYYAAGGRLGELSLPDALRVTLSSVGLSPSRTTPEIEALLVMLRRAGGEPAMQVAQREIFERHYWIPTHEAGRLLQLRRPLSYLCLYDLSIHSGPPRIEAPLASGMLARLRPRFPELPPSKGGGERLWVVRLLETRRAFLDSYPREIVRNTVYRVDALRELADDDRWDLEAPLEVRIRRPSGRVETHTIGDAPRIA